MCSYLFISIQCQWWSKINNNSKINHIFNNDGSNHGNVSEFYIGNITDLNNTIWDYIFIQFTCVLLLIAQETTKSSEGQ